MKLRVTQDEDQTLWVRFTSHDFSQGMRLLSAIMEIEVEGYRWNGVKGLRAARGRRCSFSAVMKMRAGPPVSRIWFSQQVLEAVRSSVT